MTTMATTTSKPGPHRTRRTSSDVADAILTATLEILDEVGFDGLTVEAVAARSGAAKTAVYRRWPSKVPLVVDALVRSRPRFPVPDTGSLRQDMIELWQGVTQGDRRSIDRLLPVVISHLSPGDDLIATLRERYFKPRLEAMRAVVARAAARGEVDADTDPALAFDLLFGPLHYRWLRGQPPDAQTVGQFTDLALVGLRPPG
jgi:AcrR family transcriptional regulator